MNNYYRILHKFEFLCKAIFIFYTKPRINLPTDTENSFCRELTLIKNYRRDDILKAIWRVRRRFFSMVCRRRLFQNRSFPKSAKVLFPRKTATPTAANIRANFCRKPAPKANHDSTFQRVKNRLHLIKNGFFKRVAQANKNARRLESSQSDQIFQ